MYPDPSEFSAALAGIVEDAMRPLLKRLDELERRQPERGVDGAAGKDGAAGERGLQGEKGADGKDGIGLAGAMIDRDGSLIITTTAGETKTLGRVVGVDGRDGKDGRDGMSVENVTRVYDADTHEVVERWSVAGVVKELRYPAGGIRPGGFWRDGMRALAAQAFTHDGALWIAKRETSVRPALDSEDWQLAARKGRDGRDAVSKPREPQPVRLAK